MEFELGKIYYYDNDIGRIITTNKEYIFNNNDLEYEDVKKGDIVLFRPEIVNDINRAFFISKAEEKDYNENGNTFKKENKDDK